MTERQVIADGNEARAARQGRRDSGFADQSARERALDPGQSFIVQAPAGSGKTELLTQRLLALLARVEQPEEILAITFTNKATAEMRRRVIDALMLARAPQPPEPHRLRTWQLARQVLARDAAQGWNLDQHPGRLRIRTFDALCLSLTRQMPLLSGFGTAPATIDDATPLYREAARETIAELESGREWSPSVARLLRHLDNELGLVEELLTAMLARRDQWLRRLAAGREDPRIARRQLEAALAHVNLDALTELARCFPASATPELLALADYAARQLREAGSDSPILQLAGLKAMPAASLDALPLWRAFAHLLLTKEGDWRRSLNKNIGFPPEKKGSGDSPKQRMADLIESLAGVDGLHARLAALQKLPPPAYPDGQWEVLEALVHLLPMAAAQLMLVFARRGQVDFTAVAHAAATALGRPEAPTDLALALDYRIRHILVDEFQDTSYTQYDLLERLTAGWSAGDGRTLFAVGDPMQSIYRFREAEVGLYLRARHEGVGSVALEPLTLSANFRSQSGIVEWVNHAFSQVFPAEENLASGAVPYSPSTAVHDRGEGEAVTVHPLFSDGDGIEPRGAGHGSPAGTFGKEAEAERVVELIETAQRENPAARIAVLVRARTHLAAIVTHLRRHRLRFLAIDIEPLAHRPAVQDLLAITRALESHADRVAWLSLLRAPWCGLSLADLLVLAEGDAGQPVWQAMQDESRLARLSRDGRERLDSLRTVLAGALDERGRTTRRRAVESVWLAIGGPAFVVDASDLDDAGVYLDLLESLDRPGEVLDIARLEERVARLYALPEAAPDVAVQLMTIHKAKGLEFDTVILPGLGRRPRNESKALLLWAELPRTHDRVDLLLAPLRPAGEERDPIYDYLQALEKDRRRHEDKRLLYVAATRARQHLHLLGHTGVTLDDAPQAASPAAGSLLATLWPVVAEQFQAAASATTPSPEIPPAVVEDATSMRRPLDWRCPPPPAGVTIARESPFTMPPVEYDWAGETARHVGSVVHRWLLRMAEEGLSNWDANRVDGIRDAVMAMLRRHGVANAEITQATDDVLTGLRQTLEDPRGRWLLGAQSEARSEYALTGMIDGELVRVVLDRTFVDENGQRWIVDYKTGIHTGADLDAFLDRERLRYASQLERYAHLLSALDPRPARLGLYFPRLKGWREWGTGPSPLPPGED